MSRAGDRVDLYAESASTARRFLCLCVKNDRSETERDEIRRLHRALGSEAAERYAVANRSQSIVAHGLRDAGLDGSVWREWHDEWQRRITAMMAVLDEIAERAARVGIPVVALKNGAIARALHPCRACVPMGDLDILVPRSDFGRMHEELVRLGFGVVSGGARASGVEEGIAEGGTDYALTRDGESYAIDLQWRAVSGRWLRADQEPSAYQLIGRSVAMSGTAARMLAPVDNLLQVALHTAKHTYCRAPGFRLHLDVDRVVATSDIDWSAVVEESHRLGVSAAVFLSLSIPRGLFDTPIPPWVIGALDPGRARREMLYRWLRRVSVFEPDQPKFSRVGQVVFQMALADGPASVWQTLFPPASEMRDRHEAGAGTPALLLAYGRRFAGIALRYQR